MNIPRSTILPLRHALNQVALLPNCCDHQPPLKNHTFCSSVLLLASTVLQCVVFLRSRHHGENVTSSKCSIFRDCVSSREQRSGFVFVFYLCLYIVYFKSLLPSISIKDVYTVKSAAPRVLPCVFLIGNLD